MTANLRVLVNPVGLAGNKVEDLSRMMPFVPDCNTKVTNIVQQVIEYGKDLFSKGLNATMLGRIRPFEVTGKIHNTAHGKNCSAPEAGSICYQVVGARYQEAASSVWRDFFEIQNWNATGSRFFYQARVECGGKVCEKLYVGGLLYEECKGQARNGTICNLPLLKTLCEVPETVSQAVNNTLRHVDEVVIATTKQAHGVTKIFSDYIVPVVPVVAGLAGAWAIYKAVDTQQKEGVTAKTCTLGLAGIATLAATTLFI